MTEPSERRFAPAAARALLAATIILSAVGCHTRTRHDVVPTPVDLYSNTAFRVYAAATDSLPATTCMAYRLKGGVWMVNGDTMHVASPLVTSRPPGTTNCAAGRRSVHVVTSETKDLRAVTNHLSVGGFIVAWLLGGALLVVLILSQVYFT